jgi:phosphoglycolate phosphatase-like HAD superfamily hydrolase
LQAFDGARELVQTLHERGLRLAVASSAEKEELDALLRLAGADGLVERGASGSDVDRSKPDPDVVEAALERLGCRADDAVMIGDTPYDVVAARHAGVRSIGFRCGGWSDRELAGAAALYDGPRDLLNHLDESPLAREAEPAAAAPGGGENGR